MGYGSHSDADWGSYRSSHIDTKKRVEEVYSSNFDDLLNPLKFEIRESRDIEGEHPNSNPIIFALDVTGSMSNVLDYFARVGLPMLCKEAYERQAVSDPQICVCAVGDFVFDSAPFQATQFESDTVNLAGQMQKIWFEKGGGTNPFEGYSGAHYFAAYRTVTDAFEKRKKKGYLFTIGDEYPTPELTREQIKEFFGDDVQANLSSKALIDAASKYYNIFHIGVKEGSNYDSKVESKWKELLGQRVVSIDDVRKIAEVVISIIQMNEGSSLDEVASTWDGSTALTVKKVLKDLPVTASAGSGGVVKL